jgi:hypothetical protein
MVPTSIRAVFSEDGLSLRSFVAPAQTILRKNVKPTIRGLFGVLVGEFLAPFAPF